MRFNDEWVGDDGELLYPDPAVKRFRNFRPPFWFWGAALLLITLALARIIGSQDANDEQLIATRVAQAFTETQNAQHNAEQKQTLTARLAVTPTADNIAPPVPTSTSLPKQSPTPTPRGVALPTNTAASSVMRNTITLVRTIEVESTLNDIAWSPDGTRLAIAQSDANVSIWDVTSGQSLSTFIGHNASVWAVDWSPDGTRLASGSKDGTIRIWYDDDLQDPLVIHASDEGVARVRWSRQGVWLASSHFSDRIRVWDTESGQQVTQFDVSDPDTIEWSPDGTKLATGTGYSIVIWSAPLWTQELMLNAFEQDFNSLSYSVSWSPDSLSLASAHYDGEVWIWSMQDDKKHTIWENLNNAPALLAYALWSPDGRYLAVYDEFHASSIRLWDTSTEQIAYEFEHPVNRLDAGRWSPDGAYFAVGGGKVVSIWAVPPAE